MIHNLFSADIVKAMAWEYDSIISTHEKDYLILKCDNVYKIEDVTELMGGIYGDY
jgi:hypothetical protein